MRISFLNTKVFVLLFSLLLLAAPGAFAADPFITPEQGKAMIVEKKDLVILDVRNPNEYVVAHYPGSLNIPVKELETRFNEVPSGRPVLIHCAKGKRAERAYEVLREKRPDIKDVLFIKGEPIFE